VNIPVPAAEVLIEILIADCRILRRASAALATLSWTFGNSLTGLSIISKMDIMRTVSATDAKQRLAALLDAAQREPVVIRRQNRDVAVIMSAEEFERMRDLNAAEFQRFCDRVAAQAKARGLTASVLNSLLKD
jgi:prevent-host-death family protein